MKKIILLAYLTGCIFLMASCSKSEDNQPLSENQKQQQDSRGQEDKTKDNETEQENSTEKVKEENQGEQEKDSKEKEEKQESKTLPEVDLQSVEKLSADAHSWGQGVNMDENNRPVGAVQNQELYGKYDADFIKETKSKEIYLTFDEGYENGYTAKILDALKEVDCPAVFFVTMDYVKSEPELVKRMIQEGHVVGAHSVTHPSAGLPSLSLQEQEQEIVQLHEYVQENFGYSMYLFRFPAGIYSEQSLALLQQLGYRSVFWSFAYADWDPDNQMEVSKALQKAKDRLHDGAIYLLHAVSSTNSAMLTDFVEAAREEGYTFVKYEQ